LLYAHDVRPLGLDLNVVHDGRPTPYAAARVHCCPATDYRCVTFKNLPIVEFAAIGKTRAGDRRSAAVGHRPHSAVGVSRSVLLKSTKTIFHVVVRSLEIKWIPVFQRDSKSTVTVTDEINITKTADWHIVG